MDNIHTIFFFEDDEPLAKEIKEYLQGPPKRESDPKLVVKHYAQAADAFKAIKEWPSSTGPAAALLDLRQENYTDAGMDICKELMEKWETPAIILSDYDSIADQIIVHDFARPKAYLSKAQLTEPNYKELLRSVLIANIVTGPSIPGEPDVYESGSLKVDMDIAEVSWKGKEVDLNGTDLGILDDLARPENRRKPRNYMQLLQAGGMKMPDGREQLRANVRKRIQLIRKAFTAIDADFDTAWKNGLHGLILVSGGRGYRWVPDE